MTKITVKCNQRVFNNRENYFRDVRKGSFRDEFSMEMGSFENKTVMNPRENPGDLHLTNLPKEGLKISYKSLMK